jgi:hypothetical protein
MWADLFNRVDPQSPDGAAPKSTLNSLVESGAGGANDLYSWINRGVDVYNKVTAAPLQAPNTPAPTVTTPGEVGTGKILGMDPKWLLIGVAALVGLFFVFRR